MKKETQRCPYCGTIWAYNTQGVGQNTGWSGFMTARVNHHIYKCRDKTFEQRYRWINNAEARQYKKPGKHSKMLFDREQVVKP